MVGKEWWEMRWEKEPGASSCRASLVLGRTGALILSGVRSQWVAPQRGKLAPIYILGLVIFVLFSVLYHLLPESDAFPLFSCLGKHLSMVIHTAGS